MFRQLARNQFQGGKVNFGQRVRHHSDVFRSPCGLSQSLVRVDLGFFASLTGDRVKALLDKEKTFSVVAILQKPSESVEVHVSPVCIAISRLRAQFLGQNDYAGVGISLDYKPRLSADQFPVPNTRPQIKPEPVVHWTDI